MIVCPIALVQFLFIIPQPEFALIVLKTVLLVMDQIQIIAYLVNHLYNSIKEYVIQPVLSLFIAVLLTHASHALLVALVAHYLPLIVLHAIFLLIYRVKMELESVLLHVHQAFI